MAVASLPTRMIDREIATVVNVLKTMAQELTVTEIVDLTKDEVNYYGANVGPKFKRIFDLSKGAIVRTKRGVYAHRDYVDASGKFREVPRAEPKPPEEKKEPAPPRVVVPAKTVDEIEPSKESLQLLQAFKDAPTPPPTLKHTNDIVLPAVGVQFTGVVTGVEQYGVFVEKPNTRLSGLIHISNFRETIQPTAEDLQEMFAVGDDIVCRVVGHRPGKRLALSMRGYPLPEPRNKREPEPDVDPRLKVLEQVKPKIVEEQKMKTPVAVAEDAHFEELISYLVTKIGKVSAEAREKLYSTWQTHGMFNVMMAFTKAVDSFDADVSVLFAQELEKQMGNRL